MDAESREEGSRKQLHDVVATNGSMHDVHHAHVVRLLRAELQIRGVAHRDLTDTLELRHDEFAEEGVRPAEVGARVALGIIGIE